MQACNPTIYFYWPSSKKIPPPSTKKERKKLFFNFSNDKMLKNQCLMYMYLVFCLIIECKFVFGTTSRNFVDLEPVDCGLQSNADHNEDVCLFKTFCSNKANGLLHSCIVLCYSVHTCTRPGICFSMSSTSEEQIMRILTLMLTFVVSMSNMKDCV